MENKRLLPYTLLGILLLVLLIWMGFHPPWLHQWRWANEPLHSTLEAVGALAGIMMGIVLLQREGGEYGGKLFLLALGFIGMGLLDGFHAVTTPGHGFVLLHSMAVLVGGFWFALIWLPESVRNAIEKNWLPWAVAAGSIFFGLWTLLFRETLPLMVYQGQFTATALVVNTLAGAFFLAAAGRLLLDFHRSGRLEIYFFIWLALLLGTAGILFRYSALWDGEWWLWHLLRLVAFLLALGFVIRENQRMFSGLKVALAEQKLAEESLRETRNYLENLLDYANAPIIVWDPSYKITRFNHAFERLTGYTANEMVGQELHLLFPKASREESLSKIEHTSSGEYWESVEIPILRKDGEVRLALWNSANLYAEDGITLVATIAQGQDITGRKRAEAALEAERQRLFSLLDELPALVYLQASDYSIRFANRYFRKCYQEMEGKYCYEILHGRKQPCEKCPALIVLETKVPQEFASTHIDGRNYQIYHYPFYDLDGSLLVLVLGIDMTERKKAEEKLKQTLEELTRSNQELQQFAYVASHDLQEPLRMVSSFTQLLARRYQGQLSQEADEFIGFAVEGANRMQRLINDLLAYSRVGTRGKDFEPTDCEEILNSALVNLKIAIEESSALVNHDPLPTVMADDTQLTQLFQNLISNAIKFRRDEPPRIHISAQRRDKEWLFSFSDNGIGIGPQYFNRIFVIFQRLHGREDYPGTGIGLALCKRIVERHGGRVWVESQPGNGSTFYFTISIKGGG